jgi:hypothetical protein
MDAENIAKQFMYQRLKELILKHKMDGVDTIARAIRVLFPEESELAILDLIFEASLEHCRNKNTKKAIIGFNRIINECYRLDILLSPRGAELYRLGKWSYERDPRKAERYLSLYLHAQEEYCGEICKTRWRRQAEKMVEKLRVKK